MHAHHVPIDRLIHFHKTHTLTFDAPIATNVVFHQRITSESFSGHPGPRRCQCICQGRCGLCRQLLGISIVSCRPFDTMSVSFMCRILRHAVHTSTRETER